MSLSNYALISLEDIREALGLEASETDDDNLLTSLINRISTRIESYCGRKFVGRLYTEYQDGDGEAYVALDQYPIIMVSGLWDDTDRDFEDEDEISSDDYLIYEEEGYIKLYNDESTFIDGSQNIKIIYSGGYNPVPDDLKGACAEAVMQSYRRIKEKHFGYSSRSSQGGSLSLDLSSWPNETKLTLNHYKKISVY